jgi:hypothetical protein
MVSENVNRFGEEILDCNPSSGEDCAGPNSFLRWELDLVVFGYYCNNKYKRFFHNVKMLQHFNFALSWSNYYSRLFTYSDPCGCGTSEFFSLIMGSTTMGNMFYSMQGASYCAQLTSKRWTAVDKDEAFFTDCTVVSCSFPASNALKVPNTESS